MRIAAICAIEMMTSGVTTLQGKPLQQSKVYQNYFLQKTRGQHLYCDYQGYNALDEAIIKDKNRKITLQHNHVSMEGDKNIVIGGVDAFKYYESVINVWYICWYAKRFNTVELADMRKYRPNLTDFTLISSDFLENYLNCSVYRRTKDKDKDIIMPNGLLTV